MMWKETIKASGTQVQDVASELNLSLSDYLTGTGLFQLISVETGYGNRPKYTLKYREAEYYITLQSNTSSLYKFTMVGIRRGDLDDSDYEKYISYGSVENARISIHLITSRGSLVYKMFDADGGVKLGGSCLRYTKFSGERGYMCHAREATSLLGYMGRYEIEPGVVCQVSYPEFPYTEYAVVQECPILRVDHAAIGYVDDLVTISASRLISTAAFSAYRIGDTEYHGGRLICGANDLSSSISSYTAAAMRAG